MIETLVVKELNAAITTHLKHWLLLFFCFIIAFFFAILSADSV